MPYWGQLGAKMKISIEKRTLRADGTRSLRLVYDYGYTTNTQGGRQNKRKRSYETLDLYVHDKPKTPTSANTTKSTCYLLRQSKVNDWLSGNLKNTVLKIEANELPVSLTIFKDRLISKNKPLQLPIIRSGSPLANTCCYIAASTTLALMSWIKTG